MAARSVVFYSWQADLPAPINRTFIGNALEKAAKSIRNDATIEVEPVVVRSAEGAAGCPDIAKVILERIERSQVFVCDVSIINAGKNPARNSRDRRLTPNPNVLLELGYAMKALGENRIILVCNLAFGKPETLPFDIRGRHMVLYHLASAEEDRTEAKKSLERDLAIALRTALSSPEKESSIAIPYDASLYIKRTVPMLDSPDPIERKEAIKALVQSEDPSAQTILIAALNHPACDVRIDAALGLLPQERIWPQLVPVLLDAQPDQGERYSQAFNALNKMVNRTIPEFMNALHNGKTHIRYRAIMALRDFKELDVENASHIIPLTSDASDSIRAMAADILGRMKAIRAVPALKILLSDHHPDVRRRAVTSLGSIKPEDALQELIDALSDNDGGVQTAAVLALKGYGERVVPRLIDALDSDDNILRYKAIEVLGQLKSSEAIPKLINALDDPDDGVRRIAIGSLGDMRVPNLTDKLVEALADSEAHVRSAAAYSLGLCGSTDAVPALLKALNDTFVIVRMRAAHSLGCLKDRRAVVGLRAALGDEHEEVRMRAAWALGEIKGTDAIDALWRALQDKEGMVRNTAIEALRNIGTEKALEALRMYQTNQRG